MIPVASVAPRRPDVTEKIQAETGIDEPMIAQLVDRFYARVRDDAVLGPVFAARTDDQKARIFARCGAQSAMRAAKTGPSTASSRTRA